MNQSHKFISTALKGAAMGVAEVIPGVSGGTIAFITGIYETLLNAIKSFSPKLIGTFKEGGVKSVWSEINGFFLVSLLCGMVVGLIGGLFGVSYLLENFPLLVWGFFFGLILGSSLYVGRQIPKWGLTEIVCMIVGAVVAFGITMLTPASGNEALWFVFLSGVIAISAFMLPGLSGSFMLLLLGMYKFITGDILKEGVLENQDPKALLIFFVFALGCLTGVTTVSRLLSWTFKNYRFPTLALLTGFMLGSLNKVWPWRQATLGMTEEGQVVEITKGMQVDKVLKEVGLLPNNYADLVGNPQIIGVIVTIVLGFVLVFALDKMSNNEPHVT